MPLQRLNRVFSRGGFIAGLVKSFDLAFVSVCF
jgi:hypothetical protein